VGSLRLEIPREDLANFAFFGQLDPFLGIEFKGLIRTSPTVDFLVETISMALPRPQSGFTIGPVEVIEVIDEWVNGDLNHRIVYCSMKQNELTSNFATGKIIPTFGSNLSPNGLVLQMVGESHELSEFYAKTKQLVPLKVVSTTLSKIAAASPILIPIEEEVLTRAYNSGFYNSPKTTSLRELSNSLGISKSSVANHLRGAENRLIEQYFEDQQ
jgi:hypothetical protein